MQEEGKLEEEEEQVELGNAGPEKQLGLQR